MKQIVCLVFTFLLILCEVACADPLQMTIHASKAVDLTQPLYMGMPYWPVQNP